MLGVQGEEVTPTKCLGQEFHCYRLQIPLWVSGESCGQSPESSPVSRCVHTGCRPGLLVHWRQSPHVGRAHTLESGRERAMRGNQCPQVPGKVSPPDTTASLAEHKTGSATGLLESSCPALCFQGAVGIVALTISLDLGPSSS